MMSPGLNLVMTVIGFAVSTMFIVFVCTRLICARIHLRNSRIAFAAAAAAYGSDPSHMERGLHGLEPSVVAGFPTKKFAESSQTGEDLQCTICLADYHEKDVLRTFPYCGHSFHAACIDIWLKQNFTCPICRISLRDSSDRKRAFLPSFNSTPDNNELASIQTGQVGGEQPLSHGDIETGGKHAESPSYS